MQRYGQYCPVAAALDLLGDRWTLLIVRDLLTGDMHFNELSRGLPRLSRTLLVKRLRFLEEVGVARRSPAEEGRTVYGLTAAGEAVRPIVEALLVWGATWAFETPEPEDLDPLLLMWWMRRRVRTDQLPDDRVVIEFAFHGRDERYWLVLQREDVSVCLTPPGFDVDLWIEADLSSFFQVWLGRLDFVAAEAKGLVRVRGAPALERSFPRWFDWSPAAEGVRSVRRLTTDDEPRR